MKDHRGASRRANDILRAALLILICVTPGLWIGGVLPGCTMLLLGLTALLLGLLLVAPPDRPTGPGREAPQTPQLHNPGRSATLLLPLILGLSALFIGLQLLPWPASLVALLSPRALALRQFEQPLVTSLPLTLDVPGTVLHLAQAVLLLLVGLAASRLCQDGRRARRLLLGLTVAGGLQVAVAAIHLAQGNRTSVLGIYPFPPGWDSGLGTFINCNHAASLLLLTACANAGLALEARGVRRAVLWLLLLLQLGTLLCAHSRGGFGAAALAAALITGMVLGRRVGEARAFGVGLCGSALAAGCIIYYVPWLSRRLRPLWDGTIWGYQKVRVWLDTPALVRDFLYTGVGRGAFQSVFAAYRTGDEYVIETSPASLPLQHAAELGLPATVCLWILGALAARDLWRRRSALSPAELCAAAGCAAVLAHNLVEFSLELPGVAVPWVACLAMLNARARRHDPSPRRCALRDRPPVLAGSGGRPPVFWLKPAWSSAVLVGLVALLCGGAAWGVRRHSPQLLYVDNERLRRAVLRRQGPLAEQLYASAAARHPADPRIALLGASTALTLNHDLLLGLRRANRVLALHPADGEAHWVAAQALRALHRTRQAVSESRQAWDHSFLWSHDRIADTAALVGQRDLIDAVRQDPELLAYAAAYLSSHGYPAEAARARGRIARFTPAP